MARVSDASHTARPPKFLPFSTAARTKDSGAATWAALAGTVAGVVYALSFAQTGKIYTGFGVALASFAWLLAREYRRPRLGVRTILVCGAALTVVAIVFPMRTSRDVWAYADYGRMITRYHASPFTSVPADFPQDFWFRYVNPRWHHQGSVYGPLFAGTAALFMRVGGESLVRTRLLFQLFAAIIVWLIAWLVWRRTREPVALALIVLNPLVVISVVNGGHNDPLVALGFLASVLLLERKAWAAAGVALALAALVKVVAVLPAVAIVYWLWRRRSLRRAVAFALPFGVVFLVVTAVAGGTEMLKPLRSASELVAFPSFWHAVLKVSSGGTFHGPAAATGRTIVRTLSALSVLVVGSFVIIARTKRTDARSTAGAAVLVYLLAASYVLPWYAIWVLPVAALAWRTRMSLITVAYSSLLSMSYFPLSSKTGGVIRGVRTAFTTAMAPIEIAAIVVVIVLSLRGRVPASS